MMRLMAGPERNVAVPAQETVNITEETRFSALRFENGLVAEFVEAVDQKCVQDAVQIDQRDH